MMFGQVLTTKHNHVFDEQAIPLETREQDTLVLCCQLTKES